MPQSPFDVIVITSPDQQSARAVRQLIVSSCGSFSSDYCLNDSSDLDGSSVLQSQCGTVFISTCDPFNVRLGSGGGTLAALAEADLHFQNNENPTVLICHAGGQSTRCPTQIALGKAWTSLPVISQSNNGHDNGDCSANQTGTTFSTKVSNPTSLLIQQLSHLFHNVPRGSVVVAASDVLLQFNNERELLYSDNNNGSLNQQIDFTQFTKQDNKQSNAVVGLAVPAPLSTARNHGVFVVDSKCIHDRYSSDCAIHHTSRVLQKPTVDEMRGMLDPSCVFERSIGGSSSDNNEKEVAWIDTGAVAFLPAAASVLRELSLSATLLKGCTRRGLEEMYQESLVWNHLLGAMQ